MVRNPTARQVPPANNLCLEVTSTEKHTITVPSTSITTRTLVTSIIIHQTKTETLFHETELSTPSTFINAPGNKPALTIITINTTVWQTRFQGSNAITSRKDVVPLTATTNNTKSETVVTSVNVFHTHVIDVIHTTTTYVSPTKFAIASTGGSADPHIPIKTVTQTITRYPADDETTIRGNNHSTDEGSHPAAAQVVTVTVTDTLTEYRRITLTATINHSKYVRETTTISMVTTTTQIESIINDRIISVTTTVPVSDWTMTRTFTETCSL